MTENSEIRFSEDWFSFNTPFLLACFRRANWKINDQREIVEIGSYEGRSTIWLANNLLTNADSKIYCVDTFLGSEEHSPDQKENLYERFVKNVEASGIAHKLEILRTESWKGLSSLITRGVQADMLYVHGSHQTSDVLEDAILGLKLLKSGGIMVFDDYMWSSAPEGTEEILSTPRFGIDLFINLYRRKLTVFGQSNSQVVVRKT